MGWTPVMLVLFDACNKHMCTTAGRGPGTEPSAHHGWCASHSCVHWATPASRHTGAVSDQQDEPRKPLHKTCNTAQPIWSGPGLQACKCTRGSSLASSQPPLRPQPASAPPSRCRRRCRRCRSLLLLPPGCCDASLQVLHPGWLITESVPVAVGHVDHCPAQGLQVTALHGSGAQLTQLGG